MADFSSRWREVNNRRDIFAYWHITPEDIEKAIYSLRNVLKHRLADAVAEATTDLGSPDAAARSDAARTPETLIGKSEKEAVQKAAKREAEARMCLAAYMFDSHVLNGPLEDKTRGKTIEFDPRLLAMAKKGQDLFEEIRRRHADAVGTTEALTDSEAIIDPEDLSAVEYIKLAHDKKTEAVRWRGDPDEFLGKYGTVLREYIETDGTGFVQGMRKEAIQVFWRDYRQKHTQHPDYEGRVNFLTDKRFREDEQFQFDPSGTPHEELMRSCDEAGLQPEHGGPDVTPEQKVKFLSVNTAEEWQKAELRKWGDIRTDARGEVIGGIPENVRAEVRKILYHGRILRHINYLDKSVVRSVKFSLDGEKNWPYILHKLWARKHRPQWPIKIIQALPETDETPKRDFSVRIRSPIRGVWAQDLEPIVVTNGKYHGAIRAGLAATLAAFGLAWIIPAIPIDSLAIPYISAIPGINFVLHAAMVAIAARYGIYQGIAKGEQYYDLLIWRNYKAVLINKVKLEMARVGTIAGFLFSGAFVVGALFVPHFPLIGYYSLIVAPVIAGTVLGTAIQISKSSGKLWKYTIGGAAIYMATLTGAASAERFFSPGPNDIITADVLKKLREDSDLKAVAQQITVETTNKGDVELTGTVNTETQKAKAVLDASKVDDVKAVKDSLTVRNGNDQKAPTPPAKPLTREEKFCRDFPDVKDPPCGPAPAAQGNNSKAPVSSPSAKPRSANDRLKDFCDEFPKLSACVSANPTNPQNHSENGRDGWIEPQPFEFKMASGITMQIQPVDRRPLAPVPVAVLRVPAAA